MSFATVEQLAVYLHSFQIDDPADPVSKRTNLQSKLDLEAAKLEAEWDLLYGRHSSAPAQPDPEDEDNPPTWLNLLLELLNLETVAADLISQKVKLEYQVFYGQSKILDKVARERRAHFASGGLHAAILRQLTGEPIPTENFLTLQDSADDSGFTPTVNTKPSSGTVTRFGLRETAWVRGLACRSKRNPQDIGTMSTKALNGYKLLTRSMVSPQVSRIWQTPKYTPEKDGVIMTDINNAWKVQREFASGEWKLKL